MSRYLPSLAASLSKRIEHGRQTHMIPRVETSRRCRCSGGMGSLHSSQCSWAASAASFAAFSDSSLANRRSEEKAENGLPCSTIYSSAHRARRGDLYYAFLAHEQRDGLQMQLRSIQAPPRPAHVVAMRAPGASKLRPHQATFLQRFSAAGAEVTVGVEIVFQFHEEHRLTGDLLEEHPAAGELGQPADNRPVSSILSRPLLLAQCGAGHKGRRRLGLGHALGLYPLQIRGSFEYGFFYRQLERHDRGRTAVAAPLH